MSTEREEENAIAIAASNASFSGWTKTFTGPRVCAAIVYRLTFGDTAAETRTTLLPPRPRQQPKRLQHNVIECERQGLACRAEFSICCRSRNQYCGSASGRPRRSA